MKWTRKREKETAKMKMLEALDLTQPQPHECMDFKAQRAKRSILVFSFLENPNLLVGYSLELVDKGAMFSLNFSKGHQIYKFHV